MKGYSPKLPLARDPVTGFGLTQSLREVVAQNLKMLVLTSPGERIMEPLFGVGLYNFLFELNTEFTREEIKQKILQQVARYMPFVRIVEIGFSASEGIEIDRGTLAVRIKYFIPSLGRSEVLRIEV